MIGGLLFATFATLFLVPIAYLMLRKAPPSLYVLDKRFEDETRVQGAELHVWRPTPQGRGLRRGGVIALIAAAVIVVAAVLLLPLYAYLLGARRARARHGQRPGSSSRSRPGQRLARATSKFWPTSVPYQEATLYAKVSGYLGKVPVDKGDVVKAGQLLATIESQETDAQYASAARRPRQQAADRATL